MKLAYGYISCKNKCSGKMFTQVHATEQHFCTFVSHKWCTAYNMDNVVICAAHVTAYFIVICSQVPSGVRFRLTGSSLRQQSFILFTSYVKCLTIADVSNLHNEGPGIQYYIYKSRVLYRGCCLNRTFFQNKWLDKKWNNIGYLLMITPETLHVP